MVYGLQKYHTNKKLFSKIRPTIIKSLTMGMNSFI